MITAGVQLVSASPVNSFPWLLFEGFHRVRETTVTVISRPMVSRDKGRSFPSKSVSERMEQKDGKRYKQESV